MANTFAGQVALELGWNWRDDDETSRDRGRLSVAQRISDGNDENEAEAVWHLEDQELSDAGSITYDLTALVRTLFEATHTTELVTVRALMVKNQSTSTGDLVVGNATSNEWSAMFGADGDTLVVKPNAAHAGYALEAGWDVDDENKNLKLTADGGDVTYDIAIIGTLTEAAGDSSSSSAP